MPFRLPLLLLAASTAASSLAAQQDSTAVLETVRAFHAALADGDSTAALALLAPDVIVLESGGQETLDEYRAHHLPADIEFARAVASDPTGVQVTLAGDVAWISSSSATRGTFRGRPVNATGAELMVLSRSPAGWAIRAIHWSSRPAR